eukprot:511094-Heterocapsa_arctica.AAC.1
MRPSTTATFASAEGKGTSRKGTQGGAADARQPTGEGNSTGGSQALQGAGESSEAIAKPTTTLEAERQKWMTAEVAWNTEEG